MRLSLELRSVVVSLSATCALLASGPAAPAAEFPVNQIVALDQERPALAQLNDGRIVAVWESETGGTASIRMRLFDAQGASLGAEQVVFAGAGLDQAVPAIAALTDGGLVVAWSSRNGDGDDYSIAFQRYDASVLPTTGTPEQANVMIAGPQFLPQLSPLPEGAFVLVWVAQNSGLDQDLMFRRFAAGSGAVDAAETAANRLGSPQVGAGDQGHGRVASLSDGGFVIVYEDRETGRAHGVRFDVDGNPLDDPSGPAGAKQFNLGQDPSAEYTTPVVAPLANGGFVVATTTSPDGLAGSRKVRARVFDSQGAAADEFVAGSHLGRWEAPQVAGLSDGDFVVGWQAVGEGDDEPTGTWSVWLQRFRPEGTPRGTPAIINEFNVGPQRHLALASLADSGLGALWQSFGQDGDREGVFGGALAFPPLLPGFLVIRTGGGGTFDILFTGTAGYDHVLQSSTTLDPTGWTMVIVTNPISGTFTIKDQAAPAPSHKLFRAWTNP